MLAAVRDSLEGLSEELQKEYRAGTAEEGLEGKFVLDVETYTAGDTTVLELFNSRGLRDALGKERTNAKTLGTQLHAFDGLDVTAARAAIKKVEEMTNWDPETEVDEKLKARVQGINDKHQEEIDGAKAEYQNLLDQLEETLIRAAATDAIASQEGNVKLLLPHVMENTRMRRDEAAGRFIAEVMDGSGNPRFGSQGNAMTISQLVGEMKGAEDFAAAFKGTGSSGSGSPGTGVKPGATMGTVASDGKAPTTVQASDQAGLNANLENIASGKTKVEGL